jgi:hypothetical protein
MPTVDQIKGISTLGLCSNANCCVDTMVAFQHWANVHMPIVDKMTAF